MNKNTILKLMSLLLLSGTVATTHAQTKWKYTYDNAGNRTKREVVSSSSARQRTTSSVNTLLADGKVSALLDAGQEKLKVETLGSSDAFITIHNLAGIELLSERAELESTTVDLRELKHGTYILTIEVGDQKKSCKFNK